MRVPLKSDEGRVKELDIELSGQGRTRCRPYCLVSILEEGGGVPLRSCGDEQLRGTVSPPGTNGGPNLLKVLREYGPG